MQRQGELCTCRWWLAEWIGTEKAGLRCAIGRQLDIQATLGKGSTDANSLLLFSCGDESGSGGVAIVMLCGRDVRFNSGVGLIYRKSWRIVEFFENLSRRK